jgi:hypothetical protein
MSIVVAKFARSAFLHRFCCSYLASRLNWPVCLMNGDRVMLETWVFGTLLDLTVDSIQGYGMISIYSCINSRLVVSSRILNVWF